MTDTPNLKPPPCAYCGTLTRHPGMCPRVTAVEYHPNGSIKRVEFVKAPDVVAGDSSLFERVFGKGNF